MERMIYLMPISKLNIIACHPNSDLASYNPYTIGKAHLKTRYVQGGK